MLRDSIPFSISEEEFKEITISDITKIDLELVTKDDIKDFMDFLVSRRNSVSSRSARLSAIKAFFKYLQSEESFKYNPADTIKMPRLPKRDPKYLKLDEAEKLLEVSKDRKNPERDCC